MAMRLAGMDLHTMRDTPPLHTMRTYYKSTASSRSS